MPTALVTGAAGFIGSHLVDGLLDRGYQVTGLDNLSTGSLENLAQASKNDQFTLVEGDIQNQDTVERVIQGVDAVFHLAAYTSVPGSFEQLANVSALNCTGTANVLESAAAADINSVVIASSAAVYGSDAPVPVDEQSTPAPESPYAASKLYCEQLGQQLAESAGMDVVSLRFFNVYGPRQDPNGDYAAVIPAFIDRMADGQPPIIFGDGEQTRDFVYVKDVVKASVAAAEASKTGVFNVGYGERVSVNDLVAALNDSFKIEYEPIYEEPRPGDIRHSGAGISRARKELEFEPNTEFTDGLEATVEYFR